MKHLLLVTFLALGLSSYGQTKGSRALFNKLTEVAGTDYVIATIENRDKLYTATSSYLLFVNTRSGETTQVDFAADVWIQQVEQVKIDSLGINRIIIPARTIDFNGKNGIDWNDPKQIVVLSADGKEKKQLTENQFFVSTWAVNKQSGTIVIAGHYDTNKNFKYDKSDKSEIAIYDLKTLQLVTKL